MNDGAEHDPERLVVQLELRKRYTHGLVTFVARFDHKTPFMHAEIFKLCSTPKLQCYAHSDSRFANVFVERHTRAVTQAVIAFTASASCARSSSVACAFDIASLSA